MSAGTSKAPKYMYVDVHDIALPEDVKCNLPAYRALTGCDNASKFSGHRKTSTWKGYKSNPGLF